MHMRHSKTNHTVLQKRYREDDNSNQQNSNVLNEEGKNAGVESEHFIEQHS